MSPLTWSVEDVADFENVCKITLDGETVWNPVTTALVWATLGIGIGRITEQNAAEVYARIHFHELQIGAMLRRAEGWQGAPYITPEEVHAHIGLHTNATFKDEPRSKFFKRFTIDLDEAKKRYEREKEAGWQKR